MFFVPNSNVQRKMATLWIIQVISEFEFDDILAGKISVAKISKLSKKIFIIYAVFFKNI